MKPVIVHILILLALYVPAAGNISLPVMLPDTLPPPPPGQAVILEGPARACTGDTCTYIADVPVGCLCQWAVNGVTLPDTISPLVTVFTSAGLKTVTLAFTCNGQSSVPDTVTTEVSEMPSQPSPIQGPATVCEYTTHTYTTVVGPFDTCQWTVDGILQSATGPSMTYSFAGPGDYLIEVISFNPCGTSVPQSLMVAASGTAPPPPSPIQGPGESCEGFQETYTTTVGVGESCAWWVNGIPQGTTATTLTVTWTERGDHLIEARAVGACGTGNPVFRNVSVYYTPDVYLGNDTTILQGQTLLLDAGNPGSQYLWSTGSTSQTILVSVSGTYSVIVTNFCGTGSDEIEVSVIVGIEEETQALPGILIHGRRLLFTDPRVAPVRLVICDISGREIFAPCVDREIILPGQGLYIIRVVTGGQVFSGKVFIR